MKAALVFLLALAVARPVTLAQDANAPPPAATAGLAATDPAAQPVPRAQLDGRLYWARFDAEQAARRARLDQIDLKTPRRLTLWLLVPGAGLLITAAVKAMLESSSVVAADGPSAESDNAAAEHDRIVNACLAGVGGALAAAAIVSGVWWGRRRAERNRLKRQLDTVSNAPPLHGSSLAFQLRTGGVGLLMRGRF